MSGSHWAHLNGHGIFSMSITDIPEVVQKMRAEMARMLRDVADDEEPRVARRLREVAAAFEAGVTDLG